MLSRTQFLLLDGVIKAQRLFVSAGEFRATGILCEHGFGRMHMITSGPIMWEATDKGIRAWKEYKEEFKVTEEFLNRLATT